MRKSFWLDAMASFLRFKALRQRLGSREERAAGSGIDGQDRVF